MPIAAEPSCANICVIDNHVYENIMMKPIILQCTYISNKEKHTQLIVTVVTRLWSPAADRRENEADLGLYACRGCVFPSPPVVRAVLSVVQRSVGQPCGKHSIHPDMPLSGMLVLSGLRERQVLVS